jgi:hypothetical protein
MQMFGVATTESHSYLLVGIYKRGVIYPASYFNAPDDNEYISCLTTGDIFYSLQEFINSILGLDAPNCGSDEWSICQFYDEEAKSWFPLFYLLPEKNSYIHHIIASN